MMAMAGSYDKKSFWKTLQEKASDMGIRLVYKALLLYYVMIDCDTPVQAKLVIAGALAYLVCPVDLIPDFLPAGYTDDMSAIFAAYKTADAYVTQKVKARASKKIAVLFKVRGVDEIFATNKESEN